MPFCHRFKPTSIRKSALTQHYLANAGCVSIHGSITTRHGRVVGCVVLTVQHWFSRVRISGVTLIKVHTFSKFPQPKIVSNGAQAIAHPVCLLYIISQCKIFGKFLWENEFHVIWDKLYEFWSAEKFNWNIRVMQRYGVFFFMTM